MKLDSVTIKKYFVGLMQVLACIFLSAFLWVLAAPLIFQMFRKLDDRFRRAILLVFLFLSFSLFGFLNVWIIYMPLILTELAVITYKNHQINQKPLFQIILLATGVLLHLLAYIIYDHFFKSELNAQLDIWFNYFHQYGENVSKQLGTETKSYKLFTENIKRLSQYIPAIYFGSWILGYYSCFIGNPLLKRFRCPEALFWVAIASFAMGFLDLAAVVKFFASTVDLGFILKNQILFKNIFIITACLYFFQGLSVSSYLMEKFKIARFWQNLWYILIIFNLPMIFVFLGLIDFIFEFRSFKERK